MAADTSRFWTLVLPRAAGSVSNTGTVCIQRWSARACAAMLVLAQKHLLRRGSNTAPSSLQKSESVAGAHARRPPPLGLSRSRAAALDFSAGRTRTSGGGGR